MLFKRFLAGVHPPNALARDLLKYLGPGILVTVGFIDPGNWAANVAAGSDYGYTLLWMVTLSTIMLIILQHNAAHLGIVTGLCLSEAATRHLPPVLARIVLGSAVLAAIATAMAEILGGAIALTMLAGVPLRIGAVLVTILVGWMLYANTYRKLEKWIIGFVSIIGVSFLFELSLVNTDWASAAVHWVTPQVPDGAWPIVMSVLGAVVMPHNLFLHSEVIQSRQWNLSDETVIKRQLRFEFLDTLFSMLIGWAINSAMILIAADSFFRNRVQVTELEQAFNMLTPLLGSSASLIFALALLFSGISSCITAGMAGGSIFAGLYNEPYDIADRHSRVGVALVFGAALLAIFLVTNPFNGLVVSQMLLSMQLPITVFLQIYLTSSSKVMGQYANKKPGMIALGLVAAVVTFLNLMLLVNLLS